MDLDEVLVALWDIGIDDVLDADDLLQNDQIRAASRALDVPFRSEESSVAYWLEKTGLDRPAFEQRLRELNITISPAARKLPKHALRKVRRLFGVSAGSFKRPAERNQEVPAEIPVLEWEVVGSGRPARFLDAQEVESIHSALEEEFRFSGDPIVPEGVRDTSLLSSALARPRTSWEENLKYPTVEMAGAALLHSLVHNHAFHNGNKRTALVSLLVFLDEHGLVLTCDEEELFRFLLRVGQHSLVPIWADDLPDREVLEIARWIRNQSRRLTKEEQPMKWLKLKQRLRAFNCDFSPAPGKGNRLDIWREVPVQGKFRQRKMRLRFQAFWSGDGAEADKNTIHELRRALHLDPEHDVDSKTFYEGATVDSFIIEYRRILQRLAKY